MNRLACLEMYCGDSYLNARAVGCQGVPKQGVILNVLCSVQNRRWINASVLCEVPHQKHNYEEWQAATQGVCPTCGTKMFRIGKS